MVEDGVSQNIVSKRIAILALSYKKSARCIAGREVTIHGDDHFDISGWIRPVSDEGEGELRPQHYQLQNGSCAWMCDVVDVPCLRKVAAPGQPENWLVGTEIRWDKVGEIGFDQVALFAEQPDSLWMDGCLRSDRVPSNHIDEHPIAQSLYLIHLPACVVYINHYGKRRVSFKYAGQTYDLSMTDPLFFHRFDRELKEAGRLYFEDAHACVSLGGAYQGHHYKLVASLFS